MQREVPQVQATRHGRRDLGIEQHMRILHLRMNHFTQCVDQGECSAFGQRKTQRQFHDRIDGERFINAPEQFVLTLALGGSDQRWRGGVLLCRFDRLLQLGSFLCRKQIDLVPHMKSGTIRYAQVPQDFLHRFVELLMVRA